MAVTALLNAGAQAIGDAGPKLEDAVAVVAAQWNGLQGLYEAPEVETVLGEFAKITPHGEFVRAASELAAAELRDFAAGVAIYLPPIRDKNG